MEKTYLVVENGVITNIVVSGPEDAELYGWHDPKNLPFDIGWKYENDKPVPPLPNEIVEKTWVEVRQLRDGLLRESDINVLPDRWAAMSEEQKKAWQDYRQQLRDIPQNNREPFDLELPQKPQ